MGIEICAVGGYGEVGKNMTAVRVDDEVVILDMGLHMPNYIKYTEEELGEHVKAKEIDLRRVKAIPDDTLIKDWKPKVKAIIIGHAHLDHIGAAPYMADKYNCPIIATPFTCEVLKTILKDDDIRLRNPIKPLPPNGVMQLTKNIKIEFVHVTHSTPQTVLVALHTRHGIVAYGNDFKLDNNPTLGRKPNYEALKKLGERGVHALIIDSLYSWDPRKTPSEGVARDMLRDVLLNVDSKGKAVIVTTFASHVARLKSILEAGHAMGRKVVFLGRSINKYLSAAERAKVAFFKGAEICKFKRQVIHKLGDISKGRRDKYLICATGHQGEPNAILSKIARHEYPFRLMPGDHVVFSCTVIPADVNKAARAKLDKDLREHGARLFTDIHVSGHCFREDLREVVKMLKPTHIIPTHSEPNITEHFYTLAEEEGYRRGRSVHRLITGERLSLEHHHR